MGKKIKKSGDNFFSEDQAQEYAAMMVALKEDREKNSPIKGFTITCNNCGSTDVMDWETVTICECGNRVTKPYWHGNLG